MKEWIINETAGADFGDERLQKRLAAMLERMEESPAASVHSAFKGWAEVMGAYRFFDNKKVSVESVLAPHQQATLERVKTCQRILLIQDTTELDYTPKKHLKGSGPLSVEQRQGFFAHNHWIITPERLPLGVWETLIWARGTSQTKQPNAHKKKPIEEKESFRWLQGYRSACDLKERAPGVEVISCGDRENDIYEIFEEWQQRKEQGAAEWLIRCSHDRVLAETTTDSLDVDQENRQTIKEKVAGSPLLGTFRLGVKQKMQTKKVKRSSKKTLRTQREATMALHATRVTLRPPFRKGHKLSKASIFVVMARETHPPENEDPIEWILLTSLEVATFQTAMEIVELYAARWEIEVFHRVLKTGCKVEDLQLKKEHRTKVAVALYMIVAWRVLYVMKLSRACSEVSCNVVFDEDEWQAFWLIVHDGNPKALSQQPTLGAFVKKLAEFAGFSGRKGDGDPGPQYIWQGMQQLRHFTMAYRVFVKKEGFKAFANNA